MESKCAEKLCSVVQNAIVDWKRIVYLRILTNRTSLISSLLVIAGLLFFTELDNAKAQTRPPPLMSTSGMSFHLADNGMRDELDPAAFERMKRRVEWIWISAEGVIKPDTPEKFRNFLITEVCGTGEICGLQEKGIKTVAFHSPGGNLAAGLKLGRMIRKLGLRTAVASTLRRGHQHSTSSGRCFSACGYAFLGGIHRRYDFLYDPDRNYWDSYGTIGVHRFKHRSAMAQSIEKIERNPVPAISSECRNSNETARVQCVDAVLIQYIENMGVDIGFFQTVTETGNERIEELDIKTLRELNVLTDEIFINWEKGRGPTPTR